jgi:hypothetical protein
MKIVAGLARCHDQAYAASTLQVGRQPPRFRRQVDSRQCRLVIACAQDPGPRFPAPHNASNHSPSAGDSLAADAAIDPPAPQADLLISLFRSK